MQEQFEYNQIQTCDDEEINIDLKKIFSIVWSRRKTILKVFVSILVIFIILAFIMPKKYKVESDLYINKSNNSNMVELNPYFIEEAGAGGLSGLMNNSYILVNELEIIKSPLVIDKVIRENDLRFKKFLGIIPTRKTGEYLTTEKFLKKNISFENKKGTYIIEISYKNKNKDLAYNVVNSIISNYIALHKELNSEKSKSDKALIEKEYSKAKSQLENKVKTVSGLPSTAMTGAGNLSAMSAFSTSAQRAMSNLQGQYVAGEKSELEVKEDAEKVAQLASKLQWAKLVDEMSDSSKVLVIKEPQQLRDYEYASPKLLINIILGIIFGIIASLFAVIFKELTDTKLSYSMLGDDIIYDVKKDFISLKADLLANENKKITFVQYENMPNEVKALLVDFNISFIKADLTNDFISKVKNTDVVYNLASINKTDAELYKHIKNILNKMNIKNVKDVLIKE